MGSMFHSKGWLNRLEREIDCECAELNCFEIEIDGQGFSSSIMADLARALIDVQHSLDRLPDAFKSKKVSSKARHKDKFQFEFEIAGGCTRILIRDIGKWLESFTKMTSTQCFLVAVIVIAVTAGCVKVSEINAQKEIELQELKLNAEAKGLVHSLSDRQVMAMLQAAETSGEEIRKSFADNVPMDRIGSISFNGNTLNRTAIQALRDDVEKQITIRTVEDDFLIARIDGSPHDSMKIYAVASGKYAVSLEADRLDPTDLFSGDDPTLLDNEDLDCLWVSMKNKKPIRLQARMEFNEDQKMLRGKILKIVNPM